MAGSKDADQTASKATKKTAKKATAKKTETSAADTPADAESLGFQAEVSRLLDIVAHSLYSNKEIFLRELISNASDACDKLRYAALTDGELLAEDPELKITLSSDPASHLLSVCDNGVGMSRDELVGDLGTIARSGTAAFVGGLSGDAAKDSNLIGQFGVGFYSAFMVADKVTVTSRKAGSDEAWTWESDGKGMFTISPADSDAPRGTRIDLALKKDQAEFSERLRLTHIVRTYSDHIALPIILAGDSDAETEDEQLNAASALWTRPKSEIDATQYTEFYHHVSHNGDEPWLTLHNKAEGVIEYTSLLYVPSIRPYDLFHPERNCRLRLYVRRVFITDDCAELLPQWLRFLQGVIDSEDLPLNVSREMLQDNPVVAKIRAATVKRVLGELKKKAEKAADEYSVFWDNFGPVVKEGLYEDLENQPALLELARFRSTLAIAAEGAPETAESSAAGWVSLKDYVARMKDGQSDIYYINGDDPKVLAGSPQLEAFRARGIEVLLLTDPIDEFWLPVIASYQDKPLRSATRGDINLDTIGAATGKDDASTDDADKDGAPSPATDDGAVASLIALIKLSLGERVKDVRSSKRLTDSPVCLVADEGDMDMHLERMLRQHQRLDSASARILELNPSHPLIAKMAETVSKKGAEAGRQMDDYALLLLDQARIIEGETLSDPVAFSQRLATVMASGFAADAG